MNAFRMNATRWCIAAIGVALLMLGSSFFWPSRGDAAPPHSQPQPFGLAADLHWSSSHVVGAPDPPSPFTTRQVNPDLKLDRPLDIQISSDGKRWFISQEQGLIYTIPADRDTTKADLFLDLRVQDPRDPKANERRRIWSLTFHPKYAENGYVYVCFLEYKPQPSRCRIARYTVKPADRTAAVPTCSSDSEFIVCEWLSYEDHFGGCLRFGPDGMLYFSVGDGSGYADGNESGQDLSDFNASLLRIDVDHADKGKSYAVPKDNPFVNLPGARPEIWAYGLRNVWKFSIDRPTGQVWACDVGQDLWESVILVEKGGNYGWSVTEGTHGFREHRKVGPTPIQKPVYEHEHSEARSATGGFVYHGKRFPELSGRYVYGDYETGKVWALLWDGKKVVEHRELVDTPIKLVAFGQDAQGELMLLDYQGTLHRLEHNPAANDPAEAAKFPRKLSQTGLFSSTKEHRPAEGVVGYEVNSPLWSDGAAKERFIAVPAGQKIDYRPTGTWGFPEGSVLVKTFEMDMEQGNPATRRRLETRLMHLEQGHWRGYTYLWNQDQSDADLLEDPKGKNETLSVRDKNAPGGVRQQVWHYPSRAECTLCHTMPSNFVLGLSTIQMNRTVNYGGVKDNQIRALEHAGLFKQPVVTRHEMDVRRTGEPDAYESLPRMPNPSDTTASLDGRVRAYMHSNCAHCHQKWGGGNALFELPFSKPLLETRTLDISPQHGDLGIADAKLLCPGDPARSLLLQRMKRRDELGMPRVASSVIDPLGVELIEQWIREMPKQ